LTHAAPEHVKFRPEQHEQTRFVDKIIIIITGAEVTAHKNLQLTAAACLTHATPEYVKLHPE